MADEPQETGSEMLDRQRLRTFLLGGAAGILAGILLAPRSGRELRSSVANRVEEARERGRETLFEARERMHERMSEAREGSSRPPEPSGDDVSGPGAGRSEELRRKVQETRARLRERLEGPRSAGEDRDLGPDS
jgi:gas vesicle protein